MIVSSTRRRGFNTALVLAVIALILAAASLFLLFSGAYDPSNPGSFRTPFQNPLKKYDFENAVGAAKAEEFQIKLNRDTRATMELEVGFMEATLKEKAESFKVDEEVPYTREKAKDDKKKGKGSGEFKVLLVSYKQDGETIKKVIVMEHYPDVKMWKKGSVDSTEVGKDLAKKMADWK